MAKADNQHRAFRDDILEVMKKHGAHLRADELLAVASHLVGQLIALQDQRTITPELAMMIVIKNIKIGNKDAIDSTLGDIAGTA